VVAGTHDVADRLSCGVDKFVLRTSIESVAFNPATRKVRVTPRHGQVEDFDHVVMATQANTAAHLLDAQSYPTQLAALRSFAYESSSVVLHTDPRLMPPRRSDWSSLNMLVDHSRTMPMATMFVRTFHIVFFTLKNQLYRTIYSWMNQAQTNLPLSHNVFQTWNPLDEPAAETVLGAGHFERPVIDHTSRAAQVALEGMQGLHGVWFAGAYVKQGIPLLEAVRESIIFIFILFSFGFCVDIK
jgi:predicted NAD/FAD-binding protein